MKNFSAEHLRTVWETENENRRTSNIKICPKCGQHYTGHPAISRVDNATPICPECGIREALESIGITPEEQEEILDLHRSRL